MAISSLMCWGMCMYVHVFACICMYDTIACMCMHLHVSECIAGMRMYCRYVHVYACICPQAYVCSSAFFHKCGGPSHCFMFFCRLVHCMYVHVLQVCKGIGKYRHVCACMCKYVLVLHVCVSISSCVCIACMCMYCMYCMYVRVTMCMYCKYVHTY